MRVALISQIAPPTLRLIEWLREQGHEPVAVLTARRPDDERPEWLRITDATVPPGLDLLYAKDKHAIEPLLRSYEPDVTLCWGFPWKIPQAALDVARLGSVNNHAAPLPRHRGPIPMAWAFREQLGYIGITWHRMDAELDTGRLLAQGNVHYDDDVCDIEEIAPRLVGTALDLLPGVFERLEAGDPGDEQDESQASWAGYFEPEYAHLDLTRTARELHDQVRAWAFAFGLHEFPGPLLDGERVLRTSLTEREGARRVECADGPLWIVESEPAPA